MKVILPAGPIGNMGAWAIRRASERGDIELSPRVEATLKSICKDAAIAPHVLGITLKGGFDPQAAWKRLVSTNCLQIKK